jgi:hypothetical protein
VRDEELCTEGQFKVDAYIEVAWKDKSCKLSIHEGNLEEKKLDLMRGSNVFID